MCRSPWTACSRPRSSWPRTPGRRTRCSARPVRRARRAGRSARLRSSWAAGPPEPARARPVQASRAPRRRLGRPRWPDDEIQHGHHDVPAPHAEHRRHGGGQGVGAPSAAPTPASPYPFTEAAQRPDRLCRAVPSRPPPARPMSSCRVRGKRRRAGQRTGRGGRRGDGQRSVTGSRTHSDDPSSGDQHSGRSALSRADSQVDADRPVVHRVRGPNTVPGQLTLRCGLPC
jgi:hypothetical protein